MTGGDPLGTVGEYGARIDRIADAFLKRNGYAPYGMMRYFMGYADEHFNAIPHPVGKRIRPGLLLLIADGYGLLKEALPAALSIELFHNFTLIHDDVVDHDELRRGRPTVWKLWGIDHAINTGDAELLLSLGVLDEPSEILPDRLTLVRKTLTARYIEVIEGQYLDFTLAAANLDGSSVNIEAYLAMINRKTAKLIRAATETPAIIASKSEEEVRALGDFGENLGMAYQLYDDWQSIWGESEKTGKRRAGDIYERKKTLPVIHAREHLPEPEKQQLVSLYSRESIDDGTVADILVLFDSVDAKQELEAYATRYKDGAIAALHGVSLPDSTKATLERIARALIPEFVVESR